MSGVVAGDTVPPAAPKAHSGGASDGAEAALSDGAAGPTAAAAQRDEPTEAVARLQPVQRTLSERREIEEGAQIITVVSAGAAVLFSAEALWDRAPEAGQTDDLAFAQGDTIEVLQVGVEGWGDEWAVGQVARTAGIGLQTKVTGFFPLSFVRRLAADLEPVQAPTCAGSTGDLPQQEQAAAAALHAGGEPFSCGAEPEPDVQCPSVEPESEPEPPAQCGGGEKTAAAAVVQKLAQLPGENTDAAQVAQITIIQAAVRGKQGRQRAEAALLDKELRRARKKFDQIDKDGSGRLDGEEMHSLALWVFESFHPGGQPLLAEDREKAAAKLRTRLDADGDGKLDFDEFAAWFTRTCQSISKYRKGLAQKAAAAMQKAEQIESVLGLTGSPEEAARIAKMQAAVRGKQDRKKVEGLVIDRELKRARKKFEQMDVDGSGALEAAEMEKLAMWVFDSFHPGGEPLAAERRQQEAQKLLGRMDADGDGRLDFDEFAAWFTRTCQSIGTYRRRLAEQRKEQRYRHQRVQQHQRQAQLLRQAELETDVGLQSEAHVEFDHGLAQTDCDKDSAAAASQISVAAPVALDCNSRILHSSGLTSHVPQAGLLDSFLSSVSDNLELLEASSSVPALDDAGAPLTGLAFLKAQQREAQQAKAMAAMASAARVAGMEVAQEPEPEPQLYIEPNGDVALASGGHRRRKQSVNGTKQSSTPSPGLSGFSAPISNRRGHRALQARSTRNVNMPIGSTDIGNSDGTATLAAEDDDLAALYPRTTSTAVSASSRTKAADRISVHARKPLQSAAVQLSTDPGTIGASKPRARGMDGSRRSAPPTRTAFSGVEAALLGSTAAAPPSSRAKVRKTKTKQQPALEPLLLHVANDSHVAAHTSSQAAEADATAHSTPTVSEDATRVNEVTSPWVHEFTSTATGPAPGADAAVQSAEEVLGLEHALAAKRARQLYRELVFGLNDEAIKLLGAHPPKREAALSRLHEAKRLIETEGVRLTAGGSSEMTAKAKLIHRGGRPGEAVVEDSLHDELCFMTYYNLGRLCSRALFSTKNGLHQSVSADLSLRDADASGLVDVRKGNHHVSGRSTIASQSMSSSTYLTDRWRLAKKWLSKALSHLPPAADDNVSVQIAAHAEYAMVITALGDDTSTAEAHGDRVVQLATKCVRALKSRCDCVAEQKAIGASVAAADTRASASALAIELKSAASVLEVARLYFHVRRVRELIRQVVNLGARQVCDDGCTAAAAGRNGTHARSTGVYALSCEEADAAAGLTLRTALCSASAPSLLSTNPVKSTGAHIDVSATTSRREVKGNGRKSSSQGWHDRDGTTAFSNDAVINRLAGPAASSRMIVNGQIHRGVQEVPRSSRALERSHRGRARSGAAAAARRKPSLSTQICHRLSGSGATSTTSKPRHAKQRVVRPNSAPANGRALIVSQTESDEPVVLVSAARLNALEERCRLLEESLLAQNGGT